MSASDKYMMPDMNCCVGRNSIVPKAPNTPEIRELAPIPIMAATKYDSLTVQYPRQ